MIGNGWKEKIIIKNTACRREMKTHKNNEMKMRSNDGNNSGNDDGIDFSVTTLIHSF